MNLHENKSIFEQYVSAAAAYMRRYCIERHGYESNCEYLCAGNNPCV